MKNLINILFCLLLLMLYCINCNKKLIKTTNNPMITEIQKEFKNLPRYGVAGIKVDNIETYAVGTLTVFVYNEIGVQVARIENVNYIIRKNDHYLISNKNKLLGMFTVQNHTIDWYCL